MAAPAAKPTDSDLHVTGCSVSLALIRLPEKLALMNPASMPQCNWRLPAMTRRSAQATGMTALVNAEGFPYPLLKQPIRITARIS